jgi:hypothetical protein
LSGLGKVASFRTQVSRTSFKVRFRPAQRSFAASPLHEGDCLCLGHGLSGVAFVRNRQRRRKPEPQNLAANYCCPIHNVKLTYASFPCKRWIAALMHGDF